MSSLFQICQKEKQYEIEGGKIKKGDKAVLPHSRTFLLMLLLNIWLTIETKCIPEFTSFQIFLMPIRESAFVVVI